MIDILKRHESQVLRRAEHTWRKMTTPSSVSEKTPRWIATDNPVISVDNAAERERLSWTASKAEAYREVLVRALTEHPSLRSVESLHRARQAGRGTSAARARRMHWRSRCGRAW